MVVAVSRQSAVAGGPRAVPKPVLAFFGGRYDSTNRLSSERAKCLGTHTQVYPFYVAMKSAHFTTVFFFGSAKI